MKKFTSKTQQTGKIGEDVACRFLVKSRFKIVDRNYTKKWGEIDIVVKKKNIVHFVEVKTSRRNISTVSHETSDIVSRETFRVEENVSKRKLDRIKRAIKTYVIEKSVSDETNYQIDLLVVYLDVANKKARIEPIWNIC